MSVNKTWNNTVYSIPNTRGESGWESNLSSYLQALADNAATTTFNKQAVRKATTTPVTVSASTDCTIIVDLAGPGPSTVNLPAGADKQIFVIVDGKGDASTNNITIDANGSETIEGSLTKVIRLNRECLVLQYSSSAGDWKVIGGYVPNMVGGPASSTDNAIVRFDGTTGKLVQNSGATIDDTGAVTFGPSSFSGVHNINGVVRVVVPGATTGGFRLSGASSESHLQFLGTNASTNGSLRFYSYRSDLSNELDVGSISGSGAWTLGPNAGAGHTVYGTLSLGPTSSNTGPTPSGLTTFNDSSLSVHWRMFRLSATTIDHYISGTEYHIINASGGVKLTVGATSWAAISDERKKKNISSLEYGLNEVMQINPIRFDYNSDDSESGKRIGFSAQNLRPIIPESVSEDVEMDVLSASSTELIPVLVKAIQELKAELDVAKARIEALENP